MEYGITLTLDQTIRELKRFQGPLFCIAIGLPGSGKSTFIEKMASKINFVIASTDDIVDREAKKMGLSYSDAFNKLDFRAIQAEFNNNLAAAIAKRKNIVIDQTNISSKSRRSKIDLIPAYYVRIALVFEVHEELLRQRLRNRAIATGKYISDHVIKQMTSNYQAPTKNENFDLIIEIQQ